MQKYQYHQKFVLIGDQYVYSDIESNLTLNELTLETERSINQASKRNELIEVIGPERSQLINPKHVILVNIERHESE